MNETKNDAYKISGMHHISMKCKDKVVFEKSVAFYKDILGFTEERRWAEGVMLQAGSARLEIFCNGEGILEQGAIRHFALETKNVDELAAKVKAAGYEVFIEPKDITIASQPPFHARMAFFYGPLGEQVELFNPEQTSATPATPSNIQVLRASEEWQRAGAYSVRIEGMNRQHHIPLRDEFDEHDCDGTKYIVLLDDGYPVATCRFYENNSERGQANLSVTLGRVVVLPQYRGLGLGKKVVTEAEVWAKELGYKQIDIDSRVEAIHFYEKLGYLHATGNDEIIKSGSFECVQMYKEL
jgi:predicted GNAT family N-acyltransferase